MAHKIQENLFLTFTVGYFVCLATMQGLCDLSSSTRDQTPRACSENRSHWSTYPLWFMVKNTAQESQVEEIHRPRRVRSFHALSRQVSLPDPWCVLQLPSSPSLSSLMEVSLLFYFKQLNVCYTQLLRMPVESMVHILVEWYKMKWGEWEMRKCKQTKLLF